MTFGTVLPLAGRTPPSGGSCKLGFRGAMAEGAADAHAVFMRFS